MVEALREELADLTASVRAFLEWHAAAGAEGLPGAPSALHEVQGGSSSESGAAPRRPGFAGLHAPAPSRGGAPTGAFTPPPEQRGAPAQGVRSPVQAPRGPEPPSPLAASAASAPRADAAARALASQPDTLEERAARLSLIAEEVRSCQKCPLHEGRTHTVFSRGNPRSEIVFVGEGPGAEEDLQGEPFVGPAGQLLDRMIAAMGYQRDEVYICNIVKCRPPKNRKPEPAEMAACSPYLAAQLAVLRPRVIVALGATAVQGLIGTTEGITKLRGTWKLYKGAIPIMPTFHPAYLLRQPGAKREVWSDLKEVMRHLGKSAPDRG
ncbi:DNA polymerase [Sorangium cellulosum]|uniref:Type-4 uracil-DNA glycosylase n=1 Tax=Sorangium cellulosum TaxID=56 RepID=A0A4P2QAX1_SORCE|nr:uracil-DNA glycosylase [Sorangium cellulosum]AUX26243.1 DNA polymerase [Sorangium cellulosum]